MREVITMGRTVEEATERACIELNLTRDEISVEILEMPQKKLFKTIPAKVKAMADGFVLPLKLPKEEAPILKEEAPVPAIKLTPAIKPKEKPQEKPQETAQPMTGETEEKAKLAVAFLIDICAKMGIKDVSIRAESNGEIILLKADGADVGALIGRRGETMEALSYLCSLVANRDGGDYAKIGLDVGGYRLKREGDLEGLAKKVCEKVNKTNRAQMLEPMNPYERRIIHSTVGELTGVKSESVGDGAQRRVVVLSTSPEAQNDRPERYDRTGTPPRREGGFNRDNRPNNNRTTFNKNTNTKSSVANKGPRREGSSTPQRTFADKPRTDAVPTAPTRTEAINDGKSTPLYGKISF